MAALFELPVSRLLARELFVVKYSADAGGQHSLPLHRDKYSLSFNVLLSDPSWFEGGGTRLETLGVTVQPEQAGDVFMHCGQMLHGGATVTKGVRYILVAFVEIMNPSIAEEVSAATAEDDDDDDDGQDGNNAEEDEDAEDDDAEDAGAAVMGGTRLLSWVARSTLAASSA